MQQPIQQPLTNVQLELLKTFSHQLPDNELLEMRKVLALFFAQKLIERANEVWDEKQWTDQEVDNLLNTKLRKKTNK